MKDPIIISRGEENIIISVLALKDEESIKSFIDTFFTPTNKPYKVIESSELPEFPAEFYDAVNLKEGFQNQSNIKLEINYEKAKEIQKDKWREARISILEQLDVEFIRAMETSNIQKVQEITTKKQQLRDVTNISLPDDFESIINTWPEILGPNPNS
jgi:hypothetical protein